MLPSIDTFLSREEYVDELKDFSIKLLGVIDDALYLFDNLVCMDEEYSELLTSLRVSTLAYYRDIKGDISVLRSKLDKE